MAEGARDEVRYTAFLSYSHKDAAAAGKLHRRLESYRLPRRLAGTQTPRGPVPDRLWPIFRDRDELPAASDLSETVRNALAQSGALIILCSPHAAESLWVAEEIATFRTLHPDRPILAAILDGDPPDCFPAALRAFGQDGTWHEPLATDLRPQADGAHLGLLKLVAGITGVGLDELVQRDAARRIRRVMAVTGAALVAMLIMAALAVVALQARAEAERQRAEAEGLIEFMLTDLRMRLEGVGRLQIMQTVNRRALEYYDHQRARSGSSGDSAMRARVIHAIGGDQLDSGDGTAALASFREAYRVTALLMDQAPDDPVNIYAHAQSEFWLGLYAHSLNDLASARTRFERYKHLADRLRSIDPANVTWLAEVAYAEGNLCAMDMLQNVAPGEALRSCSRALARMEQVWRSRRDDPKAIRDLANRYGWMVNVWSANGRWDRALESRLRHEQLVRSLIRRDPSNFDYRDIWMRSQFGFGELLARRGQRGQAQLRFRDAAATAAILSAQDPENESWRRWQVRINQAQAGDR